MRFKSLSALIFLALLLTACAKNGGPGSGGDVCRDLSRFPQDLAVYAKPLGDKPLMPAAMQARHTDRAVRLHYAPWNRKKASFKKTDTMWAYTGLNPDKGFGENLLPLSKLEWERLKANCNYASFPSRHDAGIIIRNTPLRAMPTMKPFFLNPKRAGEGYPFDYLQHSAVWVGTPVFITNVSADHRWVLVETGVVSGWLRSQDVARVDEAFKNDWQRLPLAAITKDNVILDATRMAPDAVTGKPVAVRANLGALLPIRSSVSGGSYEVCYPIRKENGWAALAKSRVGSDEAVRIPLPLTATNIAKLGNKMMGQPYGWGGLLENRDCSATMRDLFLPFGVWLPRNSLWQGKMGEALSLEGLGHAAKEQRVLLRGEPFTSLVWLKGHIGLYLGEYDGVPVMFHNMWGLRTIEFENDREREGRAVIGRAVVTSLKPGAERSDISASGLLIQRIQKLALLARDPGNKK